MAPLAAACVSRRPTETALSSIVRQHFTSFLRHANESYEKPLPAYVERESRAYLKCGVFAHGFVRAHCDDCGHDLLVPFSCKAPRRLPELRRKAHGQQRGTVPLSPRRSVSASPSAPTSRRDVSCGAQTVA